jgi:BirA family biotin operon repressor/biotin-[acetyl-CoA-carboxylase] ligase
MSIQIESILRDTFVEQVEYRHLLSSTNDFAVQLAKTSDLKTPLLVVADQQTAGRGRGTKRWWTGAGSLAMTLLVNADMVGASQERSPLVALGVAVAVVDAVIPWLPTHSIGIHWPNDVFVGDSVQCNRKLAGILVEVLPDRRHVIGIGVNTNSSLAETPAELRTKVCSICDFIGMEVNQTDFLISLLHCLEREFSLLRTCPTKLADRVSALCLQRGKRLTIENGGVAFSGQCQGVAPDGALLLDTSQGMRRFVSGIVVPNPP